MAASIRKPPRPARKPFRLLIPLCCLLTAALPAQAGPISITQGQGLSFPATVSGQTTTVTVAASDTGAATFSATGDASTAVTATIVETGFVITTSGSGADAEIPVDSWTFGGNLTDQGGSGTATFDGSGNLTNLRVGASAHLSATDYSGPYSGSATFRLVYQ